MVLCPFEKPIHQTIFILDGTGLLASYTHGSKMHKIEMEARQHDRGTYFCAGEIFTWTYRFNTPWRTSSAPTSLVSLIEHASCSASTLFDS